MPSHVSYVLHVAPDEKFIDTAIRLFEAAAPGRNRFLVHVESGLDQPRFVRSRENVTFVPRTKSGIRQARTHLAGPSAIVFHNLISKFSITVANEAPRRIPLAWLAWGADIYNDTEVYREALFEPETQRLLHNMPKRSMPMRIRMWTYLLRLRMARARAISRMTFCSTVIPDEEPHARRVGFRGRFLRFTYSDGIDELVQHASLLQSEMGPNIQVGNSSTPTCNHADAFHLIEGLIQEGRKVVVPLSYGNKDYGRLVADLGYRMFGDAFLPLRDFQPLPQYLATLNSCGTVVMNHLRQQAMGNICASLYMGARVFLDERNPVLAHLRNLGAHVFSLQSDRSELPKTAPLSPLYVERNRAALRTEFSRDRVVDHARLFFEQLITSRSGTPS